MRQFATQTLLPLLLVGIIFLAGCQSISRDKAVSPPPAATEPAQAEPPAKTDPVPAEPPASQTAAPTTAPAGEKTYSWWFTRNSLHQVPATNKEVNALLVAYDAFYVLPNDQKEIYLTFDCGYELGYSPSILDVLDRQQVRAAFFITGHYIDTQPELVKRMHNSGHLVASHTFNHPDLTTVSQAKFNQELKLLEDKYKSVTGSELNRYLRPPNGNYSPSTLRWAQEAQYKTVFWSMALADWDPNKQPGAAFVHQHVLNNIHPGAVILLHVVSQSDTEALEQIIIDLKTQGYRFSTF